MAAAVPPTTTPSVTLTTTDTLEQTLSDRDTVYEWQKIQLDEILSWRNFLEETKKKAIDSDKTISLIQSVTEIISLFIDPELSFKNLLDRFSSIRETAKRSLYYNSPEFKTLLDATFDIFNVAAAAEEKFPQLMIIIRVSRAFSANLVETAEVLEKLRVIYARSRVLLESGASPHIIAESLLSANLGNVIHILEKPDCSYEARLKEFQSLVADESGCETVSAMGYHNEFRQCLIQIRALLDRGLRGEQRISSCSFDGDLAAVAAEIARTASSSPFRGSFGASSSSVRPRAASSSALSALPSSRGGSPRSWLATSTTATSSAAGGAGASATADADGDKKDAFIRIWSTPAVANHTSAGTPGEVSVPASTPAF